MQDDNDEDDKYTQDNSSKASADRTASSNKQSAAPWAQSNAPAASSNVAAASNAPQARAAPWAPQGEAMRAPMQGVVASPPAAAPAAQPSWMQPGQGVAPNWAALGQHLGAQPIPQHAGPLPQQGPRPGMGMGMQFGGQNPFVQRLAAALAQRQQAMQGQGGPQLAQRPPWMGR